MTCTQILSIIGKEYPSLKINQSAKVHLKAAMKELGYESINHSRVNYYKVVPKKSA